MRGGTATGARTSLGPLLALTTAVAAGLALAAPASASIRLAFEYPWYPQTARVDGSPVHYRPNLLAHWPYDSGRPAVVARQLAAARRARLQGFIHSWWGPGSVTDSRLRTWLRVSSRRAGGRAGFKNAIYYEAEGNPHGAPGAPDPSPARIARDLSYIARRYTRSPAYLRLDGRPVVFVYGDPGDSCTTADRWAAANRAASRRFYVVLKVFPGYRGCAHQPDAWHQYAPAKRVDVQRGQSIAISPGFWRADEASPRLRRDRRAWAAAVRRMAAFRGRFQLVTTWNEWGEGTAVESAQQWGAPGGPGYYAAVLRRDGRRARRRPPGTCRDGLDNDFDGRTDRADRTCRRGSPERRAG